MDGIDKIWALLAGRPILAHSVRSMQEVATEIIVVDGASTDDTREVVESRFRGRANGCYVRLAAKGGVDQDFCRAVAESRGSPLERSDDRSP